MKNVLIVEDEDFLIRVLKDNLVAKGLKVNVAKNGEDSIEIMEKNKPDIVLLDILMPKMDGFSVLEKIKKNPEWKLIPVVVLSNLGDDVSINRALKMGADSYFIKSQHSIEEVVEKIKDILKDKTPK